MRSPQLTTPLLLRQAPSPVPPLGLCAAAAAAGIAPAFYATTGTWPQLLAQPGRERGAGNERRAAEGRDLEERGCVKRTEEFRFEVESAAPPAPPAPPAAAAETDARRGIPQAYSVILVGGGAVGYANCDCPDHRLRCAPLCKHIHAALATVERESAEAKRADEFAAESLIDSAKAAAEAAHSGGGAQRRRRTAEAAAGAPRRPWRPRWLHRRRGGSRRRRGGRRTRKLKGTRPTRPPSRPSGTTAPAAACTTLPAGSAGPRFQRSAPAPSAKSATARASSRTGGARTRTARTSGTGARTAASRSRPTWGSSGASTGPRSWPGPSTWVLGHVPSGRLL